MNCRGGTRWKAGGARPTSVRHSEGRLPAWVNTRSSRPSPSTSTALTARLPSTSSVSFRNTRPPWFQSTEGGVCMPARTISNSARQTPFLSVADCARPAAPDRSGVRMDCNRGNLRAVVGSLSEPTAAAGRGPPVEVVASSMRTIAPTISGIRPLHGRQAPAPDRQRAARRQSRPLSGSQRAFRTRGGTSGYPRKSE